MSFGQKIRLLRKRLRYSQRAAAELVGVTQAMWSGWESGEYKPNIYQGLAIARLLGVKLDDLVDDAVDLPKPSPASEVDSYPPPAGESGQSRIA